MEEDEMNELGQIRERFLADARQHFLAGRTLPRQKPGSDRKNSALRGAGSGHLRHRQNGA